MRPPTFHRDFLANQSDWTTIKRAMDQIGGGLSGLEARLDLFLYAALRGKVPNVGPEAARLQDALYFARSPHAWIRTRPTELENGCAVRSFSGPDTFGHAVPEAPSTPLPRGEQSQLELVKLWPDTHLSAFESITIGSNGRVGGGTFQILCGGQEPSRTLLAPLTEHFPPLAEGGHAPVFSAVRIGASHAVHLLLNVAMHGGAYTTGLGAAIGRLHTWRTVSHLVGRDPNDPFESIYKLASHSTWIAVTSKSSWFYDLIWDGCLVCIPPGTDTLSVVAWTDSD